MQRSIVLASAMVAGAVSAAAASPIFTFLSAERYVEAWARGPFMEPAQYDHQRADAVGFEDFSAHVHAYVEDDLGQTVDARASQNSMLFSQGFQMTGGGTGETAPPAGSSSGDSHLFFAVEFMVDRDLDVPLYVRIAGGEDADGSFHFTGPGVDIHFLPWEQPVILYDAPVSLLANQTYSISLEARSDSWAEAGFICELQFWVPAPSTSALFLIAPALCSRRRR